MQIHEIIEREIESGHRTIPDLAAMTGLTERQCRNAVSRLVREGRAEVAPYPPRVHLGRRTPFTVYKAVHRVNSSEPNVTPPKDYAEPTGTHRMPLHVCDAGPVRRLWNKLVNRLTKPMELP